MADALQEGYTHSVRCLICARPARRGATLCAQCKAAVRRARHTPNVKAEYLPHAPVVRTDARRSVERKVSYSRAATRASRAAAVPALGGWGTYATIIAFGLAVCLTGYLAIGENDRLYVSRPGATAPALAQTREDAVVKPRVAIPSLAVETDSSYDVLPDEHVALFESLTAVPLAIPDRKAVREKKSPRESHGGPIAPDARNDSILPAAVAPLPVAPVAATPAAAPEPAAPDRWQQLASALTRCERENVIAGLFCKERARLQYCEGEWGEKPQCPAASLSKG